MIDVLELFAGAGGASLGVHAAGYSSVGVELDGDCCKTREAAGMETVQGNVAELDPLRWKGIDGLWASPPCTDFSRAGKRKGLNGKTGQLVWQVLRYVETLRPRWVVCEQVPDVLPIWQSIAYRLRQDGYSAWTGLLSAEQYGTPQTRLRAYLIARRDGLPAMAPVPTHQAYKTGVPQGDPQACGVDGMFGHEVLPWISMADALGWSGPIGYRRSRGSGLIERHGDHRDRPISEPAPTLTQKCRSDVWVIRMDSQANATVRDVEKPAPTIKIGHAAAEMRWVMCAAGRTSPESAGVVPRGLDQPSATITGKGTAAWVHERPAATVQDEPRIGRPGHKDREGGEPQFEQDSVRVTVQEAAVLQDFPADFPFQGSRTSQYRQVGNAVPQKVAQAAVGAASMKQEVAA